MGHSPADRRYAASDPNYYYYKEVQMKPLSIEAFLQEAAHIYFRELKCDPMRPRFWPAFFRHVGRNIEWPRESVCNVIRKPDGGHWMVVFGWEESPGDISAHYFSDDLKFRSLIPLVPFDNDPFVHTAIRALKKVKAMPEWKKIVKKIMELPTSAHGGKSYA